MELAYRSLGWVHLIKREARERRAMARRRPGRRRGFPGYLDLVCAGDPSLRADAEALLAADAQATSGAPAGASLPPGSRLGPYRIVRELGHGGMGAVYLGERADGQFESLPD
jgi:hypothetical protein